MSPPWLALKCGIGQTGQVWDRHQLDRHKPKSMRQNERMTESGSNPPGGSPLLASLKNDPSVKKLGSALAGVRRQLSRRVLLVDFSDGCAVLAQCRLRQGSIELHPIDITELPDEALEKGCPTEPEEMAELLRSVIQERKVAAKRCAVILPAAAFTTMQLNVDKKLSGDEILSQLGDSGSTVHLPFPRNQADLDLIDITDPSKRRRANHQYLLMAVQRLQTDRLLATFAAADLDLQFIDSGILAPLRLIESEIHALGSQEQLLHLNLAPGVTICTVVQRGGPQKIQRLAPVRPYPLFLDPNSEDYFPLSPEDLLSLMRDVRKLIKESTAKSTMICLGGTGSAHPGIDELLCEQLDMPVQVVKPLSHPKVGTFELPSGFNPQALSRVVGMALRCIHMEENPDLWFRPETSQTPGEAQQINTKNLAARLRELWLKLNQPIGE